MKHNLNDISCVDYLITDCAFSTKRKVVFFDRDGTVHIDKVMTRKIEDLEYFPDTFSALKNLCSNEYSICQISQKR